MATQTKTKSTKEPELVGLDQLEIEETKEQQADQKRLADAKQILRKAVQDLAAGKGVDAKAVQPALKICKRDKDWLKRMKDRELTVINADKFMAEHDRHEVGARSSNWQSS
jgi:uncharacterized protein (UPF0335 family)